MNIIWTILILGVMIFIHEMGHLVSAKLFGVKVEEFAIGMGPKLLKWGKSETLYTLRLFPIGGFCRMEGEDTESDSPRSINNLHPAKRIVVMAAGGVMNVLLALVLYITLTGLQPATVQPVVAESLQPALQPGDKIVQLDDTRVHIYRDIYLFMAQNGDKPVEVTVERDGVRQSHTITPTEDDGRYLIGFVPEVKKTTLVSAVHDGFYETLFGVKYVYITLGQLVTGQLSLRDMSGPVGVADVVDTVVDESESAYEILLNLLSIAGLIGVNLGVMNLLPLPALDGGRIVFCLIELVCRRPVKREIEGYIHFAGLALLLLLTLVITFSDIGKLLH